MLLPFSLLTPPRRVDPQTTRVSTGCKIPLESGVGGHDAMQAMIANEREANVERCPSDFISSSWLAQGRVWAAMAPGVFAREAILRRTMSM